MSVLLVWVKFSEPHWLFELEDLTEKQVRVLKEAAEAFVTNEDRTEHSATHKIAEAVGDKKRDVADPEWDSIWVNSKIITRMKNPSTGILCCGWGEETDPKEQGKVCHV